MSIRAVAVQRGAFVVAIRCSAELRRASWCVGDAPPAVVAPGGFPFGAFLSHMTFHSASPLAAARTPRGSATARSPQNIALKVIFVLSTAPRPPTASQTAGNQRCAPERPILERITIVPTLARRWRSPPSSPSLQASTEPVPRSVRHIRVRALRERQIQSLLMRASTASPSSMVGGNEARYSPTV